MVTAATDLDKSGLNFQRTRVYRGPSLGWSDVFVGPSQDVTAAGTTTLGAGASVVLVNVAGLVTIQLPDVASWIQENFSRPNNSFQGAIWIKDLGGHAAAFNITVTPFGSQKIDNLAQSFTILQNRQLLRLYPLNDSSGWFSG